MPYGLWPFGTMQREPARTPAGVGGRKRNKKRTKQARASRKANR